MLRLARNWPLWIARDLLRPVAAIAVTVRTRAGAGYQLADDPIDDRVLLHVAGPEGRSLYFPKGVAPGEGDLILDIGAHAGIYAVEALRRYPRSHLIAVEPNPISCARMRVNLGLNALDARVQVVQAAIGPRDGTGWLTPEAGGSWGDRGRSEPLREDPGLREIPLRTMQRVLAGERPALIKCNAEGAEFEVFPQLFAAGVRPRFVILMVHGREGSSRDLLDLFRKTGYDVQDADAPPHGRRFHCRLGPTS